ncbi:PTPLA-domain-containing protein [Thozetella sp. PMI_491]|nr:PTPLA-domain-containing protein [Thozetella sp. PMI_491]
MAMVKKGYLALYNSMSALLWSVVLGRVVAVTYIRGSTALVPVAVNTWTRNTQTLAVMEIVHAITGVVPAPFFTTVIQVFSRLVLVWGISYPFPQLNSSPWYSSMLLAWSSTEVIRYLYFAFKQFGWVPYSLHWLRYSSFLILYPIGISSEVVMMASAVLGPAETLGWWYPYAISAIILSYVPGSFILYTHMLKQRRKQLGGAPERRERKQK